MKKVPQIKAPRANRPRNAFDLSQKHLFTAPPGALLPVLAVDLNIHDHIRIQASDFMRTMPMNSSAFISMRSVYEFFFVPYSQLWHQYDQFITGMTDFRSAAYAKAAANRIPALVPNIKFVELYKYVRSRNDKDIFGFSQKNNSVRLLDLLGYGRPCNSKGVDIANAYTGNVNLFRLLAYNKVYADFYRNNTYETLDVSSFNVDDKNGTFNPTPTEWASYVNLHYRNAPLDYFTNLRPSPIFGDVPGILEHLNSSSSNLLDSKESINVGTYSAQSQHQFLLEPDGGSGRFDVSVQSIRSAFALDKLLSITMRAGKTYAEQIKAHFGFEVSEGRDGQVYYLGGFDSNIQVGDVTQTSGTTNPNVSDLGNAKLAGYLGKVTGKGTASGSGEIQFDAKEPGVLMCIYSLVPAMQYDCQRIDPFVVKQGRGDYFIPEFENLGMQPLNPLFISTSKVVPSYGYQPRYSEYKTALDINHGQFSREEPLSYWSIARARDMDVLQSFKAASLKINPRWLNSVFAVDYNGTELTDCMFGYAHFNIEKVSDMSEDGMPRI